MSRLPDFNSRIVRDGVKNIILNAGKRKNSYQEDDEDDKKMSAEEAAQIWAKDEIELLAEDYRCFKNHPMDIECKINKDVIGIEDVVSDIVFVAYFNQMANLLDDMGYDHVPKRINMILVGPTGCGKTSCMNSLKKHFDVPLAKYSADSITSAGYIGNKVESILIRLFQEAKYDLTRAERGIIYIDEIDKKREEYTSAGKDVNGKAVQEELLKILEPNVIDINVPGKGIIHFDTSCLTVFMGGAFVGLDKIKEKRLRKRSVGFKDDKHNLSDEEIAKSPYIAQDFIEYGFIPEFVGRMIKIGTLKKPDKDTIMKIILEGENSPYREMTNYLANVLNVEQVISKRFLESVAEELANSDTGVRALESRIVNYFSEIIGWAYHNMGKYGICTIDDDGSYKLEYEDVTYYG